MNAISEDTIVIDTRKKRYINDILLVLNFDQNLLSVNQMKVKRYSMYFEGDTYMIYDKQDKSLEITNVKITENRCFPIQSRYINDMTMKI